MSHFVPKHEMTEEDIKLQFITPAIMAKWPTNRITMETKITDGKINLRGNMVFRQKPKKADYVLYINANNPIAIVEAKDNKHTASHGLQQAMIYAQMMGIPFAYSSNGDAFMEHDFLTGQERQIPMDQFPSPDELYARYRTGANNGAGLSRAEEQAIQQPYYSSQNTYPPRYYQRNAINKTISAVAKGQDRILLVMATGTGKTYTAFQIVYRLLKSGMKKKVLYLADRNILVDQSIQQDFSPLEKTIHKINFAKDDPVTITSHEVYFSLYQQLAGNEEVEGEESGEEAVARFASLFNKDFFDLVIVDECHRGSAKKDSNWRKILEYFSSATQIGMTATPKENRYVSNIHYFGEPVYTYSLKEGIEDGFLAPFKVINDVIEDTSYTIDDLRKMGLSEEVLDALDLMTHDKNVPYMEYVAKISENEIARTVKLADLRHNSDLTRLDEIDDKARNRIEKYKAAIRLLSESKTSFCPYYDKGTDTWRVDFPDRDSEEDDLLYVASEYARTGLYYPYNVAVTAGKEYSGHAHPHQSS